MDADAVHANPAARKRGPRPRPHGTIRSCLVHARLTPEEHADLQRRATRNGMSVSEFLRSLALDRRIEGTDASPLPRAGQ